jgi:plastocyanin
VLVLRLASFATLAAAGLVLAVGAPAARTDGTLTAKVGPGASISLTDASGAAVTHLASGTYTIAVDDQATLHNFDLLGPGVSQATSIEGTGTTTWTVTFVDGAYTFQCDAHPQTMRGTFTVGTGVSPPTTTPEPKPKPAIRLVASVGPGQTISLRRTSGALVHKLAHGRYVITVHDRAAFHDFHLLGPGINRKTSVPFVGTAKWTVTLKAGLYRYRCDPHKQVMRGSFRVT